MLPLTPRRWSCDALPRVMSFAVPISTDLYASLADELASVLPHSAAPMVMLRFLAPHRFGSWLAAADLFDPAAFGMPPAEATVIDPQQRLLLESMAAVLPSAGSGPAQWQPCGVFTGISATDYARLTARFGVDTTAFSATGAVRDVLQDMRQTFRFSWPCS